MTIYRRAGGANENFCVYCADLDLNIEYPQQAPKARAINLGYFVGWQHMTLFFRVGGRLGPLRFSPCFSYYGIVNLDFVIVLVTCCISATNVTNFRKNICIDIEKIVIVGMGGQ